MKHVLIVAVVVLSAGARAQAAPITVSAGDFAIFDFDLRGGTPPPPYARGLLDIGLNDLDLPDDVGEWTFWTELDATGSVFYTFAGANLNAIADFAELNDGVVSATLNMISGSITVDPCLWGIAEDGSQNRCGTFVPPPPPVRLQGADYFAAY